ncbi:flagellar export chaperone FliS [Domibacillus epiphyticus]|uniref:flagellar export chaperone FliS n=1 Tax=Domibacillus epiphyticus TaxID=1714355 RepID=UPI001301194F|nr:flagellar export chaperone FliS [Domibacillus epiphyticus]
MDRKRAQDVYVQNSIATASPIEMAMILLQGALASIKKARMAMEENERLKQNFHLKRAQQCVLEIVPFLNEEIKEGQAASLVYQNVNSMLVKANINRDAAMLIEAEEILISLLEAWKASK